jgi:hypothetical protein
MTLEIILFIVLVFTVFFNNGVQAYIHYNAYPLIAHVGKPEFANYLKEYENRLMIPLLAPYVVTLLSNLALIFIRPAALSVIWVIIAFLLNLSVAVVTMRVATPVYNRIKENGVTPELMQQLMGINLIRLVISTVSSGVVVIMLYTLLAT